MRRFNIIALNNTQRQDNLQQFWENTSKPFEDQLKDIEKHIRAACKEMLAAEQLDEKNLAKKWILSWREYGLHFDSHILIPNAQKSQLKSMMKRLTQEYPKLTIVSGPILTYKHIKDPEKIQKKEMEFKQLYMDMRAEFKHKVTSDGVLNLKSYYLVRNIGYVYRGGICIKKHANVTLSETAYAQVRDLDDNVVFWPGKRGNKAQDFYVDEDLTIETCLEHDLGFLAKNTPKESAPLIQLILSASIDFNPNSWICPYVIHIDSVNETRLITYVEKEVLDVALYTYDILEHLPSLKLVEAEIIKNPLLQQARKNLNETKFSTAPNKMEEKPESVTRIQEQPPTQQAGTGVSKANAHKEALKSDQATYTASTNVFFKALIPSRLVLALQSKYFGIKQ